MKTNEEKQHVPNVNLTHLLAAYLKEKAENAHLLAKLWESDMEKYGADERIIGRQVGMYEAYSNAAEEVMKLGG